MSKERLILNVTPDLLAPSKDGSLKIAFFDKPYKVKVVKDDKGREISSEIENRVYIHIQNLNDKFSIVQRRAGDKEIIRDDEITFISEIDLFPDSYKKYLAAKSAVTVDHASENEDLKKRIAELEAKVEELENANKKLRSQKEKLIPIRNVGKAGIVNKIGMKSPKKVSANSGNLDNSSIR